MEIVTISKEELALQIHQAVRAGVADALQIANAAPEPAISATKLAKLMGNSRQHIYNLCESGAIPYFMSGADKRFIYSEVIDALKKNNL